jgi:hypothetical protein
MRLAQMERIARRLEFRDALARHDHDNPSLADDFAFLTELGGAWKPKMRDLARQGPTAVAGGLAGLELNPTVVDAATVTGSATEQTLIPTALMPVRQNVPSGTLFKLFAGGKSTTAATPGTYTFSARIGPAPTNASPAFGVVPSGAFTPTASITAGPWWLWGMVLTRGAGSSNTAVGFFNWSHSGTTTTGGPALATSDGVFGGVSAAFDSTGATCALWIGVTHATSTTNTWIPNAVAWGSWN